MHSLLFNDPLIMIYFIWESLFTSLVFDNLALHVGWFIALIILNCTRHCFSESSEFLPAEFFYYHQLKLALPTLPWFYWAPSLCRSVLDHSTIPFCPRKNNEETRVRNHSHYIMINSWVIRYCLNSLSYQFPYPPFEGDLVGGEIFEHLYLC